MSKRHLLLRLSAVTIFVASLVAWRISVHAAVGPAVWNIGDVFVGVGGGRYFVYDNNGVLKDDQSINDGTGLPFTTGCAFNPALDKLYTTNFSNNTVVVYQDNGTALHPIVQTIDTTAPAANRFNESVVFSAFGDFYVGHASGGKQITHYTAAGALIEAFSPATEEAGTDWLDLANDGLTMFYTSEGTLVKRFNVNTNSQLPNFNAAPLTEAYALRLLPPGDGSG